MSSIRFLIDVGRDPGFNADALIGAIDSDQVGGDLNVFQRIIYRYIVFPRVQQALLHLGSQLAFVERQQDWGPGRVDTFNPYKAIQFNFPMGPDAISDVALNGSSDFPSLWMQRPREGMHLHWDGNNTSVAERNLSAALGAGVTPVTVDRASIARVEAWMWDLPPPPFPGLAALDQAKVMRGAALFAEYCAGCHGMEVNGHLRLLDQPLPAAGQGDAALRNRHRPRPLGLLHARLRRRAEHALCRLSLALLPFPQDRGLRQPAARRHLGALALSPQRLSADAARPSRAGSQAAAQAGTAATRNSISPASATARTHRARGLFLYDTRVPGNSNGGHDGKAYGTQLPAADKDALVEYMKTL